MRNKILITFLFIIPFCCNNPPNNFVMVNVSTFYVNQAALENHAAIRVIYFSGGPSNDKEEKFYYQYIVIKEESKDTFRILDVDNQIIKTDTGIYNFVSIDSKDKDDSMMLAFQSIKNVENIKSVVSNKEYQSIETRRFPTVIGCLVKITHPGKENK